jgi:hypothetical protein
MIQLYLFDKFKCLLLVLLPVEFKQNDRKYQPKETAMCSTVSDLISRCRWTMFEDPLLNSPSLEKHDLESSC